MSMRLALGGVTAMVWALALCSHASAEDVVLPTAASQVDSGGIPACTSGPRLRAVQFDPNRRERSFVVFSGSARMQPLHQGARVGAYRIERIERGSVVLTTQAQAQRCSLRLRGDLASHELRAISADAVRSGLRARQPAAAVQNAAAKSGAGLARATTGTRALTL
jgi:hypothetical protein